MLKFKSSVSDSGPQKYKPCRDRLKEEAICFKKDSLKKAEVELRFGSS